jgi:hypothetical protein
MFVLDTYDFHFMEILKHPFLLRRSYSSHFDHSLSLLYAISSQYRERLDDLRLLKRKIDDLKRQLQIRGNEVANVETLKHEVWFWKPFFAVHFSASLHEFSCIMLDSVFVLLQYFTLNVPHTASRLFLTLFTYCVLYVYRLSIAAFEPAHQVYHLQRELLQERIKVKALSEELENPMNVHRWRKLEGYEPAHAFRQRS